MWKWPYILKEPGRGDVIVFRHPDLDGMTAKRIIGVPEDRIDLLDETHYRLNGSPAADVDDGPPWLDTEPQAAVTYHVPKAGFPRPRRQPPSQCRQSQLRVRAPASGSWAELPREAEGVIA